jgi:hypothetical protein
MDQKAGKTEETTGKIPKTRLGITEKKQATNHLGQLFAANDRLLEKLDALVKIVRTAQPAFYKAWMDNRHD